VRSSQISTQRPRILDGGNSTHPWRLEHNVLDSDRIDCFEWTKRVQNQIRCEMSSVIPGIHPEYVRCFETESGIYKPNDIWKLRHLKPILRLEVHREFRELAQSMSLTDYETEPHWELWDMIKSKSDGLRQREKDFYRQYQEVESRTTDDIECRNLLPWKNLVKYQSVPLSFDENEHPRILRPVWPTQVLNRVIGKKSKCMKRDLEETEPQDVVASKRPRPMLTEDTTRIEINDVDVVQTIYSPNILDDCIEIEDGLTEDAELQQAADKVQETARKAKIDTDIDIDKALYLEYQGHIEYIWRMFPGKSKNAQQWEKMGAWKNWLSNNGKTIPTPSEARLQEAKACLELVRKPTVTEPAPVDDTRYASPEPEAGDYEDPADASTWYKFPGSEHLYLCGHWKDRCRERKCSQNDSNHVCCHVGLSHKKKAASLRRPEYRRKVKKN
jgi:hypothetical protein